MAGTSKRKAAGSKGGAGKAKRRQPKRSRGRKRVSAANKAAESLTSDLLDRRLAKALGHEMRTAILAIANTRPISPSQYAREFNSPLSSVSYHFRRLRDLDFIELVEEVPVRGSNAHLYRGSRRGLIDDINWSAFGPKAQAAIRVSGLRDFLERCSNALEAGTFDAREDATFYWVAGAVDETGWLKFIKALRRLIEEVTAIEVETVDRRAKGESDECIPMTFAVAGFESPKGTERRPPSRAKGRASAKGNARRSGGGK